jgi:hypothetical protein
MSQHQSSDREPDRGGPEFDAGPIRGIYHAATVAIELGKRWLSTRMDYGAFARRRDYIGILRSRISAPSIPVAFASPPRDIVDFEFMYDAFDNALRGLCELYEKYIKHNPHLDTIGSEDRPLRDAIRCTGIAASRFCAAPDHRVRVEEVADKLKVLEVAAGILDQALDDREADREAEANPSRSGVDREIIETLRAVGRRLTTGGLLGEMARRGLVPSEPYVKKRLAELVKGGRVTKDPKATPRGYGLPEWHGSSGSSGSRTGSGN